MGKRNLECGEDTKESEVKWGEINLKIDVKLTEHLFLKTKVL